MPEIVKELKKETAVAMKKFNWTENQARKIYNRSVSIMHLDIYTLVHQVAFSMRFLNLYAYLDASICAAYLANISFSCIRSL
jgi:hypothetical protein